MLNVWMVNHYALAPDQAGGTRHYTLARLMQDQDIDTTIFASSVDYLSRQDARLNADETHRVQSEGGVRFVWLKTPSYSGNGVGRGLNMLAFLRAVLQARPQGVPAPDVVIGSSPHLFGALGGYLLARRHRVPFVLEIRDIWPKSMIELMGVSERHPFIRVLHVLEQYLYRQADLIVGLMPGVGNHVRKTIGRSRPFMWLPNGVDSTFPAQPYAQRSADFSVVYTGAHGIPNSLETAIEAARILQERGDNHIHLRFVGEGVSKADLMAQARKWQLRNVEFLPAVPKHEVPAILAEADAFLILWRNSKLYADGISANKLFDYLGAARPIVMAIDSPHDPVREAGAGLTIPPEDPQALADALMQLSRVPASERAAMGQRGRAYVEEHHDMKRLALRLGNALWSLTAGGRAAAGRGRRQTSVHHTSPEKDTKDIRNDS